MYAIIAVGGRQLKVEEGETVRVERLEGQEGDIVTLPEVLLVQRDDGTLQVGTPTVEGAVVRGRILKHGRGKKIIVFKHKRRKNYRRKRGHRQPYTALEIIGIELEGKSDSQAEEEGPQKPASPSGEEQ